MPLNIFRRGSHIIELIMIAMYDRITPYHKCIHHLPHSRYRTMPRRKNDYLSDGSDSDASNSAFSQDGYNSQEDQDARAERRLFELKGNKRRKTDGRSGKDAAWEGVFGEDDSVGDAQRRGGIGGRGRPGSSSLRTDWTKCVQSLS